MVDESELQRMAREAVFGQRIPVRQPDRMWGGPGNGEPCAICAAVLAREDIGLEVEFRAAEPGFSASTHQFHARCFAAWEAEWRASRSGPDRSGSDAGVAAIEPTPAPASNACRINGLRLPVRDGTIPGREHDRIQSKGS